MPDKVNRDVAIAEVDKIVSHLRIFENAGQVIKQAHADEAEIRSRTNRLTQLHNSIDDATDQLKTLEQQVKDLQKKKEEETRSLEEEQHRRVTAAQEKANRDIADAESRRRTKLQSVTQEIAALDKRLREAKEQTEQEESALADAQQKRADFVRSVTR